jgi:adenine-specific DNA-methyltransferase
MTSAAQPIREARGQRAVPAPVSAAPAVASTSASVAALLAGIPDWWACRAQAAGLDGPWLNVQWAVAADPLQLDSPKVHQAVVTGSAEEIGQAYVSALPDDERSKHGRHYTPKPLAEELWAMTKRAMGWKRPRPLDGCILDPAGGAGALLLPVLREHLGAAARVDAQLALNALPNYIQGIDNDPAAAWLGSILLASEMLPILARTERARRRPLPALIRHGDGLAPVTNPVRAVVMNPPYGRVRLGAEERTRFADYLYGHANLYGLFLAAALESLDNLGVLAALVPTSFLAGRYFEPLRSGLAKRVTLREIAFVADRSGSFSGVLQETCLAVFSRAYARKVVVSNINGQVSEVTKLASPRRVGPWLLPRRSDDALVAAAAISLPQTLAGAGWKVSTGPLVWNRRKDALADSPAKSRVRVLWAADIDGGVVHRDLARDNARFFTLSGNDEKIMVLDEPAVLIQRTTAPEQTRRLVAVHLSAEVLAEWGDGIVVENHVNVARPVTESSVLSTEALNRLFATDTIDRVLRCLSGSVAVSAYELEALPLPSNETLARWSLLQGEALDEAVAVAYRTVVR